MLKNHHITVFFVPLVGQSVEASIEAKEGKREVCATATAAVKQAAVDKAVASRQKALDTVAAFAHMPSAVFTSCFPWVQMHVGHCSREQQYLVGDTEPLLGGTVR